MAEYTIELRDVVENHNIFNFPYEFYDEEKRLKFEDDFIRHFYFREICTPSIDRFILYLNDKMQTTFPYYNMLFEATKLEYDKTANYDMLEQYERSVESSEKGRTENYTVSQGFEKGATSGEEKKGGSHSEHSESVTKDSEIEKNASNSESTEKGTSKNNEDVKNKSVENSKGNSKLDKRFLDTPQGKLSLEDSKYLTSLNLDVNDTTNQSQKTDTNNKINKGETTQDSESKTESNRDVKKDGSTVTDSNGKNREKTTTAAESQSESKSTLDNNARTTTQGAQKEKYTLTRKGNIGIMTASDMVEKHLELQRKLTNIQKLFFNECEDLFMGVY